jgi:NitT/TauT family transport system permease protein
VPFLIAGIRLGLGRALVGVVVAEMFTALAGLGYMVVLYGNTFRTAELFVPIVVLALLSIGITNLIYRLERRVAPWRRVPD